MIELVLAGRSAAEALMTDTCTVTRATEGGWSDAAEDYTSGSTSTLYAGMCRVKAENVAVREVDAGEREVGVVSWTVSLPITAATGGIGEGDTVTVTASPMDPSLVGKEFTVAGPFRGSQVTARRLPVRAVV